MKPISVLGILSALAVSRAAEGQSTGPTFVLGFEGAPERITGGAGEVKTFEVYVTLTTLDNTSPDGAQGWSYTVKVEGGTFKRISLDNLEVSTIFDHDGLQQTPPINPYLQDLSGASFTVARIAPFPALSNCVDSAVVLHQTQKMVLEPTGTQRIARLTIEAKIPSGTDCGTLSLEFNQCFKVTGQPVNNVVSFNGASWSPRTETLQVLLCRTQFRRGDFNGDGAVDISDAIANLGYLYLGAAAPGCRSAADSNDDGYVDITDPVILLSDLFRPEVDSLLPPPGPFACGIGLKGDPLGCESSPACP